jgi:hypothetical protein
MVGGKQKLRGGNASLRKKSGRNPAAQSLRLLHDKLKVALKELREPLGWLKLIRRKPPCPPGRLVPIIRENDELISIFVKSIKTAQHNKGKD